MKPVTHRWWSATSGRDSVQIPSGYNIIGTCGVCGGPVVAPILSTGDSPVPGRCYDCQRTAQPAISPAWGPVLEMLPLEA